MNIRNLLAAAAMVAATLGVSTSADARPNDRARWERGHHVQVRHRGPDRRYQRYGNRGWNGYHQSRRCWSEWRNHRRVRICR